MPAKEKKSDLEKETPKQPSPVKSAELLVRELENAGEVVADEVKQTFQLLSKEVASVTKFARKQAASVTSQIATSQVTHFLELLKLTEKIGADSLKTISENFDSLRQRIDEMTKAEKMSAAKKKAGKKKVSKKKIGKKKASKKKTGKKKSSKKKVTR